MVQNDAVSNEHASLDTLIYRHIKSMEALGGSAEWLRTAVRQQYVRERVAKKEAQIQEQVTQGVVNA